MSFDHTLEKKESPPGQDPRSCSPLMPAGFLNTSSDINEYNEAFRQYNASKTSKTRDPDGYADKFDSLVTTYMQLPSKDQGQLSNKMMMIAKEAQKEIGTILTTRVNYTTVMAMARAYDIQCMDPHTPLEGIVEKKLFSDLNQINGLLKNTGNPNNLEKAYNIWGDALTLFNGGVKALSNFRIKLSKDATLEDNFKTEGNNIIDAYAKRGMSKDSNGVVSFLANKDLLAARSIAMNHTYLLGQEKLDSFDQTMIQQITIFGNEAKENIEKSGTLEDTLKKLSSAGSFYSYYLQVGKVNPPGANVLREISDQFGEKLLQQIEKHAKELKANNRFESQKFKELVESASSAFDIKFGNRLIYAASPI